MSAELDEGRGPDDLGAGGLYGVPEGDESPRVLSVKRSAGVAGAFSLRVLVQYPGEAPSGCEFIGSVYGGPIVLVQSSGVQSFVSSAVTDRIGAELNAEWVARFFAPRGVA